MSKINYKFKIWSWLEPNRGWLRTTQEGLRVWWNGQWEDVGYFMNRDGFVVRLFSGRKDRFGTKIFEGDVVAAKGKAWPYQESKFAIAWEDKGCCMRLQGPYAGRGLFNSVGKMTVVGFNMGDTRLIHTHEDHVQNYGFTSTVTGEAGLFGLDWATYDKHKHRILSGIFVENPELPRYFPNNNIKKGIPRGQYLIYATEKNED